MLKGQMQTMRDHCLNVENEVKASRDTVARLIGEAEKGQMSVSRYTLDMEGIRLVSISVYSFEIVEVHTTLYVMMKMIREEEEEAQVQNGILHHQRC